MAMKTTSYWEGCGGIGCEKETMEGESISILIAFRIALKAILTPICYYHIEVITISERDVPAMAGIP
jgi:hypothetical protein